MSSESNTHTPGPWVAWSEEGENESGRSRHSVCRHEGNMDGEKHVCVADCLGDDMGQAYANAMLISAAPDMLAALKLVLQHGRVDDSESRMNMVAAAINKAEGPRRRRLIQEM